MIKNYTDEVQTGYVYLVDVSLDTDRYLTSIWVACDISSQGRFSLR